MRYCYWQQRQRQRCSSWRAPSTITNSGHHGLHIFVVVVVICHCFFPPFCLDCQLNFQQLLVLFILSRSKPCVSLKLARSVEFFVLHEGDSLSQIHTYTRKLDERVYYMTAIVCHYDFHFGRFRWMLKGRCRLICRCFCSRRCSSPKTLSCQRYPWLGTIPFCSVHFVFAISSSSSFASIAQILHTYTHTDARIILFSSFVKSH